VKEEHQMRQAFAWLKRAFKAETGRIPTVWVVVLALLVVIIAVEIVVLARSW